MSQGGRAGASETIVEAASAADYAAAHTLFEEYAAQLGVDLCFQGFTRELEHLPEMYGRPSGSLLLARGGPQWLGCGALRRLDARRCEMKRLYVREAARGLGLGGRLAAALIARARELGYASMVLDTLAGMRAARGLYRSLGFREIAPYYRNPLADAVYLELDLDP